MNFIENAIHPSFKHGQNFKIGMYNVIEEDCKVGDNVMLENFAYLKKGTRIGNNVVVDSYVRTGGVKKGEHLIGNGCILKIRTTLSPDTILGEDVFMGPHSMILHQTPDGRHDPVCVQSRVFVGACCLIAPGVTIAQDVIVGANSFVTKNLPEPGATYLGSPARRIKKGYLLKGAEDANS